MAGLTMVVAAILIVLLTLMFARTKVGGVFFTVLGALVVLALIA